MKVLHILAQLPMRTGSGVYFTNLIDGLKKYNNINQACLYAKTEEYEINILDKDKQYEVLFETNKLPFSIVGMSDIMPYKNTIYSEMTDEMMDIWQKNFKEKLIEAKNKFNPDVIITHHLWILTSMVYEIFSDKKIFAVCHNTDIRQAEKNPNIKEKYVKNINKIYKILSLSENQKNDITRVYKYDEKNIINLGAGYNDKIFYPQTKYENKEQVELVYAGKFDESKGIYELISAFENITKKDKNVILNMIGKINEKNKEYFEKKMKENINLKVYDVENQKELANVLRTKDIFILPSYFEGLGLIAVEALGSGLRAVTTNIEGLIEFLGEEINNSAVIEYVKMPTIYDTDKAVEEEKPDFVIRLEKAIELQIKRTRKKRKIPCQIFKKIKKHSWEEKIKLLYKIIE